MIAPREAVIGSPIAEHGGRLALTSHENIARHGTIDFSVCLNAFGPAPSVVEAVRGAPIAEYPDPRATHAREAIATSWHLSSSTIALGAGSAELIQSVCFAFVRTGDVVVVIEPAFGEYRRAATLCGADVLGVALTQGDDPLSSAKAVIRQRRPRIVFIASPANPTGRSFDRHTLHALADVCANVDALMALDQAYDAFADEPLGTPALRDHPSVLHLRSLTKEHALAGVRVAVGVGPTNIIDAIERVRVPWPTSTAAQAAAIAAVGDSAQLHASTTVAALRSERRRISVALSRLGIDVAPTSTHYMLVACAGATDLRNQLVARDILVRDCTSFGLPRHVRIAARTADDNDLLIDALRRTLS